MSFNSDCRSFLTFFFSQILGLNQLVRSDEVKTVFEITNDTTPERNYDKIIEVLTAR